MYTPRTIKDEKSFHAMRARGVGASEVFVLAGYGRNYTRVIDGKKYQLTPEILRLEKLGRIPRQPDNPAMWWGRELEGSVIKRYMLNHGLHDNHVIRKSEFIHPEHTFAISHPDLVVMREEGLVQIKTGNFFSTRRGDDPDTGYDFRDTTADGIPMIVFLQEQWEMFTSGIDTAYVALLSNTSTYREFGPIKFHPPTVEKLLALAERFMWHLVKDQPIKPESLGDVHLMFPEVKPLSITIGGEEEEEIRKIKDQKAKIDSAMKRLEEKREKLKMAAAMYIGENKFVYDPQGEKLISQSAYNRDSLALSTLKDNPWLFSRVRRYIHSTEVRRLDF